ncbi:MAG: exodeoxyribonuclease III [Spirochaetes bacterium]|nr:exodeoxyribonuclease III [Spirochaetota bacterium]
MRIVSWNVNGIRSAASKGLFEWMAAESPDVLCLQETKASPEILAKEFLAPVDGTGREYRSWWSSAKRRGYSGVALYSKTEPASVLTLGVPEFDDEGRVIAADFGPVVVVSAYFPNSQDSGARLGYKLGFCAAILRFCDDVVRSGAHVLLSGDYNIAHRPIDLAHPKANEGNPGYLPEERAWMDEFTGAGYIDSFRRFCPDPGHYSWWSYRMKARAKDVGWRIDYHCVDSGLRDSLASASILKDVTGSDHCPVAVDLELEPVHARRGA